MDHTWTIPRTNDNPLTINLDPSSRIFIVGANGAGKSALIQHAVRELGSDKVRRISAHRQTWMESGTINMTGRRLAGNLAKILTARNRTTAIGTVTGLLWNGYLPCYSTSPPRRMTWREELRMPFMTTIKTRSTEFETRKGVYLTDLTNSFTLAGLKVTIENSEGEELLARHSQGNLPYNNRSDVGTAREMQQLSLLTF